jgi:hypothetical protein
MKQQFRWWLFVSLTFAIMSIAILFGFHKTLWASDASYLSFAVWTLYVLSTVWMWFKVHRGDTNYDSVWYLADKCQDLGLLGTMIGFALAFQGLYQIDTGNPDQAKQMLFTVAIGVMTAIYRLSA